MKTNVNIFFTSLIALSFGFTQVQANKSECKICNQKTKATVHCKKKVNTIVYKGSYNKNFNFPVTVRDSTHCKDVNHEKYSILPSF